MTRWGWLARMAEDVQNSEDGAPGDITPWYGTRHKNEGVAAERW